MSELPATKRRANANVAAPPARSMARLNYLCKCSAVEREAKRGSAYTELKCATSIPGWAHRHSPISNDERAWLDER